ncbi:ABC-type multidrug transport system, ATPase component [Liquorilactobacillus aquaticus DSM 21051]|uniref:ABC-type multidrug transport system, ATPase component n=1 Tax=Liquorilactobacillus aquaticus DSM 21051 TaxID=1423725 RepID=A0A0R2CU38_9LACO|nr:ABC transporter ATP-binding protein [Liquorilactobacillus aquaticus]KRM95159.1 ABC-type multidrug transport system, ATPase component [Liquorilactobacillus aquaticus DSM 21051]
MTILQATELTKVYKDTIAVDHINLNIKAGDLVAFLGPNGAGKSTTIKMLTTILKPDAGTIRINNLSNPNKIRENIGIVFQESVLDDELTVKENLVSRAQMYPHLSAERVEKVIASVRAQSFADKLYGALSGGQKRRIDIARALLNDPRILFLDEPTTGLDIQTRSLIWELLAQMQHQEKMTIFLTTHYLEEAEQADDVYIIDHGRIVAEGTAAELKEKYTNNVLLITAGDLNAIQKDLPHNIDCRQTAKGLLINVASAHQGIRLLNNYIEKITLFEFRQGSMDDVFIKLTGREIR